MQIIKCEQGSPEWQHARMGIPTASQFDRIITPGGKLSAQSRDYMHHLLAELLIGCPIDSPKTSWMERGTELEGDAVCWYEFDRDVAVETVGFILADGGLWGCSPDRLVGTDGLLEIKCPSPQVHVGYMVERDVDKAYRVQLQGQMFVAQRAWTDICSYHPLMSAVVIRVERDEEFIAKLEAALCEFCAQLEEAKERLGIMPREVVNA